MIHFKCFWIPVGVLLGSLRAPLGLPRLAVLDLLETLVLRGAPGSSLERLGRCFFHQGHVASEGMHEDTAATCRKQGPQILDSSIEVGLKPKKNQGRAKRGRARIEAAQSAAEDSSIYIYIYIYNIYIYIY